MRTQLVLIFVMLFLMAPASRAGNVVKVSGKKVYIVFSQDEYGTFGQDDLFYLLDSQGRKRAIVHLRRVKGLKAIGVLLKGKAQTRYSTLFRSVGKKTRKKQTVFGDDDSYSDDTSGPLADRPWWGVVAGYGSAKQDVQQTAMTSSQSGSSIALKGVFDYPMFSSFGFRGMLGIEMFEVSGTGEFANSPDTGDVGSDVKYLTADALMRWHVYKTKSMSFYLAGGMGILFPFSKSSTAIIEDSIDSLVIGEFGGGVDIGFKSFVVPFDISYYYFPTGEDVKTNIISIKTGILWPF